MPCILAGMDQKDWRVFQVVNIPVLAQRLFPWSRRALDKVADAPVVLVFPSIVAGPCLSGSWSVWPRSSSFRQWHGYCWYAGYDAFALCSLGRRQARGVSTGAVCGHDYGHACRGSTTGVAVQTVLTVWRWTSLCCRSDKFQLLVLTDGMRVDFLGPCTQVHLLACIDKDMCQVIRFTSTETCSLHRCPNHHHHHHHTPHPLPLLPPLEHTSCLVAGWTHGDEGCFAAAAATIQGIPVLFARCLDKCDQGHEAFVADYTKAFLNAQVRECEQLNARATT